MHTISVASIVSVVSVQPLPFNEATEPHLANMWYVVEKLGLDDVGASPEPMELLPQDSGIDGDGGIDGVTT